MSPTTTSRHLSHSVAPSRAEGRIYDPISICGHGAFGTVVQARWYGTLRLRTTDNEERRDKGTIVAIKKLKELVPSHVSMRKMLDLPELKALLALPPHSNVVALWDVFLLRSPAPRALHLVFEYSPSNLVQLFEYAKGVGRRLISPLLVSIARQLFLGLYHIHSNGWMHRDLKPENVLMSYSGGSLAALLDDSHGLETVEIKVADFGLARQLSAREPLTTYISTRWYRSPELLLGAEGYGAGVDMWAAGAILAECVRLNPLFPGKDQVDQLEQIARVMGPPPSRGEGRWTQGLALARKAKFLWPQQGEGMDDLFPRDVPRTFVRLIKRLLVYNPAYRIGSGDALRDRLFEQDEQPALLRNHVSRRASSVERGGDAMQVYDRELAHQLKMLYRPPKSRFAPYTRRPGAV